MLKMNHIVKKSSRRGFVTESFILPQFLEKSENSIDFLQGNSEDLSMWLAAGSRANLSVWLASEKEVTTPETSGQKLSNVFAWYDHDSHSLKTSQGCLLLDTSEQSSVTFTQAGMMQNGLCAERMTLAPLTDESDSGFFATPDCSDRRSMKSQQQGLSNQVKWPSPQAFDAVHRSLESHENIKNRHRQGRKMPLPKLADIPHWISPKTPTGGASDRKSKGGGLRKLEDQISEKQVWPTPTSRDYKGLQPGGRFRNGILQLDTLDRAVHSGQQDLAKSNMDGKAHVVLNPDWVEELMGWPTGHTDLKPLEMDKFRKQWLEPSLSLLGELIDEI